MIIDPWFYAAAIPAVLLYGISKGGFGGGLGVIAVPLMALIGILIGTVLFEYMSASLVRLIVGVVAVSFTMHFWISKRRSGNKDLAVFPRAYGIIGGTIAGFTSFVAHSGGPPLNMYLLRRPLDRTDFVATTAVFFAVANYVKLVPYAWLGQFDADNLATSAALVILAPMGVLIGVWLHKRVSDLFFFTFVYVVLFVVGLKLVYDGVSGLV